MGKPANKKRIADNEAVARAKQIRSSAQKLNLIAELIRGKDAGRALLDLEFSKRRVAQQVKVLLESAIANAENNHGLDVDRLYVKEATVGRALVMKRFRARARGRAGRIQKPFSNMRIVVSEKSDVKESE
ncbi:MAG: 50S ribosomal protein L22 [Pseudomonadota bacterium]|jgi:large subunit ribosomal protein L22|nr:50S ribosomal protein L22 [Pseudomonadota bacterium]QKK05394.1 MAG: 50S ribosomal protein L22 [Pseudomonadota bacterium]|tara:strand:+ start:2023 stop:2412 length:390 start_codon:yes stop_codon:yes gene_type:complete